MRLKHVKGAEEAVLVHPLVIDIDNKDVLKKFSDRPLYLEIGCGKGQFVLNKAINNPQNNYIGVEMYSSVLFRALEKAEEYLGLPPREVKDRSIVYDLNDYDKLSNLRYMNVDAGVLNNAFAPGAVDGIYLNFSDPWPKERHAKRRLTSSRFLNRYKTYLKQGGIIEFKTDNVDLFDYSVEEFKAHKDYELINYTHDLYKDDSLFEGNVATEYEEKFVKLGNKICKLVAVYNGPNK